MIENQLKPTLLTTLSCVLTTILAAFLLRIFDLSNVVMLFLINVVFISLTLGRFSGILACILGVGAFDFFFVPPQFLFAVSDIQYIFTFLLMVIVSLITSELAVKLRKEVRSAKASADRATALARVASDLSAALKPDQIEGVCQNTLAPLFSARAALLVPDKDGRLYAPTDLAGFDLPAAQRAYDSEVVREGTPASHPESGVIFIPLVGPMATRGLLALERRAEFGRIEPDDWVLLKACCGSIALALERVHFADIARETQVRMEGERFRNALLAAVSHDLRTPLTAIRGLADALEHPADLSQDDQVLMAASIRSQSEELQRLISNLLDAARLQSDGVFLRREWHALSEVIGIALERSRTTLGARAVKIDIPDNFPLVEMDSVLLERVFENILDNASKYTEPTSAISISATVQGEEVELNIDDNGSMFPLTNPEALFEPFARGANESTIFGVGLGLSLCRSIVNAHGGAIHAYPRQPHGARFQIRLPQGMPPQIDVESETTE